MTDAVGTIDGVASVPGESSQVAPDRSGHDRLIVFARIPQAGRAKTRLIPALGPEGAAAMHAALLRRTLQLACEFRRRPNVRVEIRFAAATDDPVPDEFDDGSFPWRPQVGADLGERLGEAIGVAFREHASRVVVIGTDCPEIDPTTLSNALEALGRHDVVLGPAADGGYYLVGLTANRPELFEEVDWGSERVLEQTLRRCRRSRLSVGRLGVLSDVDRPEDLLNCRRLGDGFADVLPMIETGLVSVVVPTLDEERHLERTVRPLLGRRDVEVVVADGGSHDGTLDVAERLGVRVVRSRSGRGCQQNAGAAVTRGEILLFLHADTRLPENFVDHVRTTLEEGAIAGAFRLGIAGDRSLLRWVEWGANLRSSRWQRPYGDQAVFLRAEDFFRLRGFRQWPLMEDVEFVRRLRSEGRIRTVEASVTTSDRRWRRWGVLRTTLMNQLCLAAYRLGVSPSTISRFYRRGE